MRNRFYIITFLFFAVVFMSSVNTAEAQCAMCKAAIESSEGGEEIVKGVKQGIAYLMLFPYVLIGAVAYFWYRNYKKVQKKQAN